MRLHPNTLWATHELTALLMNKGATAEAESHARNAIRIAPENPQSHNLLGMVMTEANRPQTGEYHYRRVIELSGDARPDPIGEPRLEFEEPGPDGRVRANSTTKSVKAAPEVVPTLLGWARMEEADRNFARAGELLGRAETLSPDDPSILLTRAVLHGRTGEYAKALDVLDRAGSKR